ncbi:MAG TPA: DUF3558 family protein [Acidimicrobiales bacterium]|nr:DUF3558 family protein [Acidimicrobiales bacterium]
MQTRSFRVAATAWLLVAGLAAAACSTSAKSSAKSATTTTVGPASASKVKALTTLDQSELCGLLHRGEPAKIMGSATAAARYLNTLGLGTVCEWDTPSGGTGLYIGISTADDFDAARQTDKALSTTTGTVAGHDALFVARGPFNPYYTVQVALGGPHDVYVEYRAPTAAGAATLAKTVTPRLLALG